MEEGGGGGFTFFFIPCVFDFQTIVEATQEFDARFWHNLAIWKLLQESGMGVRTPMQDFLKSGKAGSLEIWRQFKKPPSVPTILLPKHNPQISQPPLCLMHPN